jgi:hypothetical protein
MMADALRQRWMQCADTAAAIASTTSKSQSRDVPSLLSRLPTSTFFLRIFVRTARPMFSFLTSNVAEKLNMHKMPEHTFAKIALTL